MSHRKRTVSFIAASAVALGVSAASNAAESSYEMRAYTNQPGGAEIMAGEYEAAIEAAMIGSRVAARESVLGVTANLCVAYTITGEFGEAEGACSKALSLARSVDQTEHLRLRSGDEEAKALINRGVMRALAEDPAGAASDFRAAAGAEAEAGAAESNLAYLEASLRTSPAVADASRD